jgi:hypothetical protein
LKPTSILLLLGLLATGTAAAQPECPAGNLLHGRTPVEARGIAGDTARLTDNFVAPEGAAWNGSQTTIFESPAAFVTWDLSRPVLLRHLVVQADGDDSYQLSFSLDGAAYNPLWQVDPAEGGGLRSRRTSLAEVEVRYLRLAPVDGDGFFSVAELQIFCQRPDPFPPAIPALSAPAPPAPAPKVPFWNDESSARWELVLALLGLALLIWRRLGGERSRAWRDRLLAGLGVLALFTYFNFGAFHFPKFIHDWEWTHYYLGAKYFEEVGYDKLYECIAVADSEDGLASKVARRKLTNLRTNVLEGTADILAHPERCKNEFSADRWAAFRHDVSFFRGRQSGGRWEDLQTDHGYNATPVWNVAGSVLANLALAGKTQLYLLAALDPLYFLAMAGLMVWAFGWRTAAVAMLVLATDFPSRFYWTGGSYLRWDWLFYTVAAICCLRKDRPLLAGLALGYASLLRIFPLLIFAGPLLAAAFEYWRDRRIDRRSIRFFAGAAIAAAVLLPLGALEAGGFDAYRKFADNTLKHKETPLTNHMGLRTLAAYRPAEAGHVLFEQKAADPWLRWKNARLAAFKEAKPLYFALVLGFLVLLALAARGREPWIAAALGIAFIPVGVELTCYYYAFLAGFALLHERSEKVGIWMLAATAATQFVAWKPFTWMPGWRDEQYTLMSAATLAALLLIVIHFARRSGSSPLNESRRVTDSSSPR